MKKIEIGEREAYWLAYAALAAVDAPRHGEFMEQAVRALLQQVDVLDFKQNKSASEATR